MTAKASTPEQMVREDGTYPTVPLRKDNIMVAVVQTRVNGVNGDNPEPDRKANLDYMLESIDIAQGYGGKSDLLLFHEFPITGFSVWTRKQHENVCIQVPGPETDAVGEKCKQHNCYVVFGTYATDPDWPGHILHLMVMIGPDGKVVAKHWKQRNVRGMFPGSEGYTSVIYDVYDQFVEMYGLDAVIPVEKTDIGNIAMSAVQFEPELFRCMAFKGAEIIARVATGGFEYEDMRLTSYHNSLYTLVTNNSLSMSPSSGKSGRLFFDEASHGGSGRSAIFGPRGVELVKCGPFEQRSLTMIPMKSFREKHRIPDVHMDIYKPVFDQYKTRYDHSLYLKYLPTSGHDAYKYFAKNSRWTHYW